MSELIAVNESGRRIGEDHPLAKLTNHDVDLLLEMLNERTELVELMASEGANWNQVSMGLHKAGLSNRALAVKFEVSECHVRRIASGANRAQQADHFKRA